MYHHHSQGWSVYGKNWSASSISLWKNNRPVFYSVPIDLSIDRATVRMFVVPKVWLLRTTLSMARGNHPWNAGYSLKQTGIIYHRSLDLQTNKPNWLSLATARNSSMHLKCVKDEQYASVKKQCGKIHSFLAGDQAMILMSSVFERRLSYRWRSMSVHFSFQLWNFNDRSRLWLMIRDDTLFVRGFEIWPDGSPPLFWRASLFHRH